jgi:AraC-like DNA-binding protein
MLAVAKWILAAIMVLFNRHQKSGTYYLFTGLLVLSLYDINHFLTFGHGTTQALAWVYHHIAPLMVVVGPLFLIYVRSTLEDDDRLRRSDILHLIPAVVTFIDLTPYFQLPFESKLGYADRIISDLNAVREPSHHLFLNHFLTNLMRSGLSLTYFLWCLAKLWQYHRNIPQHPEVPQRQRMITLRWMTLLVGTLAIISLSYVLMVFEMKDKSLNPELFSSSGFFIAILLFYMIASVSLLFFPEILYGLPRAGLITHNIPPIDSVKSAYRESTKSEADIQIHTAEDVGDRQIHDRDPFKKLSDAILNHLMNDKPYLNPAFSTTDLSLHFGVPRHHVDYCFAKIIGEKFTEMRKRLRVEHAKILLPEHRNMSLEGVGKHAGFASKSSFFSSFREVTGMTPAEYIKSVDERV